MTTQSAEQACTQWRKTVSINNLETPATTGFLAGHASRDAEVAAFRADWNILVNQRDEQSAELAEKDRLLAVALEAMRGVVNKLNGDAWNRLDSAIKAIEGVEK